MATPRLRPRKLSEPTIARLPVYQRIARVGRRAGSIELTLNRSANWRASPQRPFGAISPDSDPSVLAGRVRRAGAERAHRRSARSRPSIRRVVVGIGNLGRALVNSTNFLIRGAQLAALYDSDPEVVGSSVAGYVVKSLEDPIVPPRSRSSACRRRRPSGRRSAGQRGNPRAAQLRTASHQRADRYRRALRGLLDRVADPHVPPQQRHRTARWGLLHSLGILTPAPMRGA